MSSIPSGHVQRQLQNPTHGALFAPFPPSPEPWELGPGVTKRRGSAFPDSPYKAPETPLV